MTPYIIIAALIVAIVLILAPVLVAFLAMRGQFRATEAVEVETEKYPVELIPLFEEAEDKLESLGFEYTHSQLSALEDKGVERPIFRYYWHPEKQALAAAYQALEKSYPYPYNITFSSIFETGLVLETEDSVKHLQLPFPDICENHDYGIADIEKQWELHQYHCAQQEFPEKINMNPEWCMQWQTQLISESIHQMLNSKKVTLHRKTGFYRLRFTSAYLMGTRILRGPNRAARKAQAVSQGLANILAVKSPGSRNDHFAMALQGLFRARAVYLCLLFAGLVTLVAMKFEQAEQLVFKLAPSEIHAFKALVETAENPEDQYRALVEAGDFYQELGSNTNARINYRAAVETALGAGFQRESATDLMETKLKLATSYEENVMVRKNIFVMLEEAITAGDTASELATMEYLVIEDIPAFSIEEKLEYATNILGLFTEKTFPNGEQRTIRISQHMAGYFDGLGMSEEATELRKQIVIHRRALAESKS